MAATLAPEAIPRGGAAGGAWQSAALAAKRRAGARRERPPTPRRAAAGAKVASASVAAGPTPEGMIGLLKADRHGPCPCRPWHLAELEGRESRAITAEARGGRGDFGGGCHAADYC